MPRTRATLREALPRAPQRVVSLAALPTLLAVVLAGAPAGATEVGNARVAGLGFAIGEPTGIVGKYFVGPENAWDAGLSFFSAFGNCRTGNKWESCSGQLNIAVNVDYLWQYNLLDAEVKLDWHFGGGGRIWLFSGDERASNLAAAVRMPLGFDLTFRNPRFVEVFLEFSPALYILPAIGFNPEPAIGVRFYF
jgi:hypothetical protein